MPRLTKFEASERLMNSTNRREDRFFILSTKSKVPLKSETNPDDVKKKIDRCQSTKEKKNLKGRA